MAEPKKKRQTRKPLAVLDCGIVMPISQIDGCSREHWSEVHTLLSDAIETAGFKPNLVSDADDVGVIQRRIVQNLYENPVVVCDVSGKNPNVMFELGLRLAFDKPTIIVKDDKTTYSFDTGQIEHLEYPRDLRFGRIVDFKSNLSDKIKRTYERANKDPEYTTFLKHFGKFAAATLDTKNITKEQVLIDEIQELKRIVMRSRDVSYEDGPLSRGLILVRVDRVVAESIDYCKRRTGDCSRQQVCDIAMNKLRQRYRVSTMFDSISEAEQLIRRSFQKAINRGTISDRQLALIEQLEPTRADKKVGKSE